ncbi:MAG: sulfatase [Acidobacteriota bacterium]
MSEKISRRSLLAGLAAPHGGKQPNILLMLADNWAWPHAGACGDKVVETPVFDRLAAEGMLFTHAFAPNPSCSPSRSWLLTGQETHRLGAAASLYGTLRAEIPTYVGLLEKAGYFVGFAEKGWGPGTPADGGYSGNPVGREFPSFEAFLHERPKDKPFCFWFGSHDPHVPWNRGQAGRAGIDMAKIEVPKHLPDNQTVRGDIRDYYAEVQQFDAEAGEHVEQLRRAGELDGTVVAMTSDNGWQIPRGLGNCYDLGVRIPMVLRYPKAFRGGTKHDGFVTVGDLCPTFLEAAGVRVPAAVTAKSLLKPPKREAVFLERERHANVRAGNLSYPVRGVRTREFLYLRNLEPDRWPAGDPEFVWSVGRYGDIDDSPTKQLLMNAKPEPFFSLCMGKRPAEELYELKSDPGQVRNVAGEAKFAAAKARLSAQVDEWMRATGDPRANGRTAFWDEAPYTGPKFRGAPPK